MARLALGTFVKLLEQLFEPLDVSFRLFEMLLKSIFQLRRRRSFRHLRQRIEQLILGAVKIA